MRLTVHHEDAAEQLLEMVPETPEDQLALSLLHGAHPQLCAIRLRGDNISALFVRIKRMRSKVSL